MRYAKLVLLFLAFLLAVPAISRAQNVASINGVVTDSSGAAVPGASVKLTDTRTGTSYFAKTAGDGGYRIVEVPPGPGYSLTIRKDGFQTMVVGNIYLPVATATTQNAQMQLGSLSQTVEVTVQGAVTLDTTDATIGNSFDLQSVQELPNQFRDNPAQLLQREPGVTPIPTGPDADDPLISRGGSVTGARTDQSNIIVDGIDESDFGLGQAFTLATAIPVDAIQEFKTDVANPVSDTGRGSGATTFITTKSGSNQWHGTAQEWNRTAATEANSFFNKTITPIVPREQLVRNQFGANLGGPIKKDKLFFFFDYDGRRDAEQEPVLRVVPLANIDALGGGGGGAAPGINYINNGSGCNASSRLNTSPGCISLLSPTGACGSQTVQGLDPLCIGADAALTSFIAGRYPAANDMTQGDGVNTGGFRFSAAAPLSENIYLARLDYNLSSKHKIFTRFDFNNQRNADANQASPVTGSIAAVAFPGDPLTAVDFAADKAWVIGDTWTITPNTINQFVYGESRNQENFTIPFNPNGTNFQFEWMNFAFDPPYLRQSTQSHIIPEPTFRDDWSQTHGTHTLTIGGVFRPVRTRDVETNDFNFIGIGLNGLTPNLTPALRPANILAEGPSDPTGVAASDWDNMYMGMLGSWWLDEGVFEYNKSGTPLALGAPHRVDYRYYESEFYAQDTWRITPSLTMTYGLRYQYDSVPYETNGLEGVSTVPFNTEFDARLAAGAAGMSGEDVTPFLTYQLGGKANPNAPSLYHKDPLNFAPRLAFAWNPSVTSGPLASVLGDRKTVFRAGAAVIYDHTALNSVNFIQDQNSFLFSNVGGAEFGGAGPAADLASDPRFTGINNLPVTASTPPTPPPFANPLTPNVFGGVAFGQAEGSDNYTVDPNFKTPYSLAYTADMQRELPWGLQMDLGWVGRYAHRLIALADANQLVDFNVPADGQTLFQAIGNLETEARAGATTPTAQPILEDPSVCGPGCSDFIYSNFPNTLIIGGLGNIVNTLATIGALQPGIGLAPQFESNLYLTNKGWSSYNGLLITLTKRLTHDLQGDFNYTFSHSIDNISVIADNIGNQAGTTPAVDCDARSGAACRGDSEFDLTHEITGDLIYTLPFGHGQRWGSSVPNWVDEAIGGWEFSDITTWHTGLPFNAFTGAQTTSLLNDALGDFDGDKSALAINIHKDANGNIQLFSNPAAAAAAFSFPTGQQVGNRNVLRGPHFSDWDMAVAKKFNLGSERYSLQFRAEAYNAFNHPNFALPGNSFGGPLFGVISSTVGDPREMQFALRFDF